MEEEVTKWINDEAFRTKQRKIWQELQLLGLDKVEHLDPNLEKITLALQFSPCKTCHLVLSLPERFPEVQPNFYSNDLLDEDLDFKWSPNTTFVDIFEVFKDKVEKMEQAWSLLDELDQDTWVVDPDQPTGKDMHRRVIVQPGVSLLITIDPKACDELPKIRLLGPDSLVNLLRRKLAENISQYQPELGVKRNLENLLEIYFPKPDARQSEDFHFDCAICYLDRLGDDLPEEACPNAKCARLFHTYCLFDYLKSERQNRVSINSKAIYGHCPGCEEKISCQKPTNAEFS